MKKAIKIIFVFILVLVLVWGMWTYLYGKKTLKIQTQSGTIVYQVELALTPQEQQTGLMYRKHLAPRTGMLFLFKPVRVVHMWMKNTFIPLDMVFFDSMGRVTSIYYHANPHDLTAISSVRPVAGVLELNAGDAEKYNLKAGATLDLSSF